jgi:hypothetical protein
MALEANEITGCTFFNHERCSYTLMARRLLIKKVDGYALLSLLAEVSRRCFHRNLAARHSSSMTPLYDTKVIIICGLACIVRNLDYFDKTAVM